jgi:thiol-disulfide isomerase/thioredoxin
MERNGKPPARSRIADQFGVSVHSVDLLLTVMEIDRRVPKMFDRDRTGEITRVHRQGLDSFLRRHSDSVRVTGWEGKPVPEFDLQTLEGKSLSSRSLKGSNSLLYFWFTGCPPCVRIAPILESLHQRYGKDRLRVVGMNADRVLEMTVSDRERIDYLKKQGLSFPNVQLTPDVHKDFGNINVYPTLFLVDSSGTVFRRLINYQSQEAMDRVVSELVGP